MTQELAHRSADGIEVSLLWTESTDELTVTVFDSRTEELLRFRPPRDRALDAFHHPFAYASAAADRLDAPALAA